MQTSLIIQEMFQTGDDSIIATDADVYCVFKIVHARQGRQILVEICIHVVVYSLSLATSKCEFGCPVWCYTISTSGGHDAFL